jgi:hypothetical protein
MSLVSVRASILLGAATLALEFEFDFFLHRPIPTSTPMHARGVNINMHQSSTETKSCRTAKYKLFMTTADSWEKSRTLNRQLHLAGDEGEQQSFVRSSVPFPGAMPKVGPISVVSRRRLDF